MAFLPRATAAVVLALLGFPSPCASAEPPPGVGQWIGGIRATRDGTLDVARAHLDAMSFVDGQILAAELAMVCRAVDLAARDARVRSRVESDTAAGRMRRAILPLVAARLKARHACLPGQALPEVAAGGDLPRAVHQAVGLLDLTPAELTAAEGALHEEERRDGDMEEAVTELGDWVTRHDELVRRFAAMNLALRHVHHGQVTGAGERAFERLREVLERAEE